MKSSPWQVEIRAHPKGIRSAAFSPDGTRVLIGGAAESGVSLWDASSGECLRSQPTGDSGVATVEFSADGRTALFSSQDEFHLWDLGDGSLRKTFKLDAGKFSWGIRIGGWFTFAGLLPDGRHVVTVTSDQEVTLWDLDTASRKRIREPGGQSLGGSVALSPDGTFAILGSPMIVGSAVCCDLDSGRVTAVPVHTTGITSVAIGAAGVLTGSYDGTACLWDGRTGQIKYTLKRWVPHTEPPEFRQAGKYALSESHADGAQIWDMTSGKVIRTLESGDHYDPLAFLADSKSRIRMEHEVSGGALYPKSSENAVMSVALSHDGRLAATGTCAGRVHLWDLATGKCTHTLEGFPERVSNVAFSPSGTHLLAASRGDNYQDKGIVRIWDIRELEPVAAVMATSASLAGLDQRVEESIRTRKWDEARALLRQAAALPGGVQNPHVRSLTGHTGRINSVAVSPDGRKALTASDDGTARVWDLGSSRQEVLLDGRGTSLLSATFSSDGRQALVIAGDRTARVYDLSRGTQVVAVGGQDSPVDLATLHRKGHTLATANGNQVVLWDARTGQRIKALAHHDCVIAAAFTSDDVLTATQDGTFQRWAVKRGEPSKRLSPGRVASAIVFLAGYLDNSHEVALTCASDGTARLWDINEGVCLGIAREHAGNVVSVADCRPGEGGAARYVITACDNGNAYLWNLESGRCERRAPCPSMSAKTVAYSPRMKCMLTSGKENEVQVWTAERK